MKFRIDERLITAAQNAGLEILWQPDEESIPESFTFEPPASIKWMAIKNNVHLGAFSYAVSGYFDEVEIGRYCSIGENVQVGRGNHPLNFLSSSPFFYESKQLFKSLNNFSDHNDYVKSTLVPLPPEFIPEKPPRTIIGNDVWIGHNAFIKPGIKIGNGAVIGAYSVVTKDVPSYAIVAGNPAKFTSFRFSPDTIRALNEIEWWNYSAWDLDIEAQYVEKSISKIKSLIEGGISLYKPGVFKLNLLNGNYSFCNVSEHCPKNKKSWIDDIKPATNRNRDIADKFFSEGHFELSRTKYSLSIKENEANLIYTYMNGATLAEFLNDDEILLKYISSAISLEEQDQEFFKKQLSLILGKIIAKNKYSLLNDLQKIVHIKKIDVTKALRKFFIVGFPRCGTTYIANCINNDLNGIQGLLPEGIDHLHSKTEDECIDAVLENLSWSINSNFSDNHEFSLVDKSTPFCLSKPLMQRLISRYPDINLVYAVRDPYERSLSAYRSCNSSESFEFLANSEVEIIKGLGGINCIYEDFSIFKRYVESINKIQIPHPIIYPSALMLNRSTWETFLTAPEKYSIINIDTGITGELYFTRLISKGCL